MSSDRELSESDPGWDNFIDPTGASREPAPDAEALPEPTREEPTLVLTQAEIDEALKDPVIRERLERVHRKFNERKEANEHKS